MTITKEQLCLSWFRDGGYDHALGPDTGHESAAPERADYHQMVLLSRLVDAKTQQPSYPQSYSGRAGGPSPDQARHSEQLPLPALPVGWKRLSTAAI